MAAVQECAGLGSNRFQAVVFDLDGTLLDTLGDLVLLTNSTLAEFNFPARTPDEIHSFVGNGVRPLIEQAVPVGTPETVVDQIMGRWKSLYAVLGNKLTRPYDGIIELATELSAHGVATGVLSNKFEQGVIDCVGEYLPGLFAVVHGERPGIPRKPDPQGLRLVFEELGCDPSRSAYVGDSPTDILCAQRVGAFAIGVGWGYHEAFELRDAGADAVVDHPLDILALNSDTVKHAI